MCARANFVLSSLQIASGSCQCAPRGKLQLRSLPWLFMAAGSASCTTSMDPLDTLSGFPAGAHTRASTDAATANPGCNTMRGQCCTENVPAYQPLAHKTPLCPARATQCVVHLFYQIMPNAWACSTKRIRRVQPRPASASRSPPLTLPSARGLIAILCSR